MAQLIKLQDYVSRYQIDLAKYSTHFVRMKKNHWEKVKHDWESSELTESFEEMEFFEEEEKKNQFVSVLKKFLPTKKEKKIEEVIFDEERGQYEDEEMELFQHSEPTLEFEPTFMFQPDSIDDLKRMFKDQFFTFQLKWASSTIREKSYVDPKFFRDSFLKTLIQRLPDNILIFYYPIIQVKKAPIELDIIILTPTECLLITVCEQEDQAVFVGSSERFWLKKIGKNDAKLLNPLIQLDRMETIVQSIFASNDINFPVKKILLSRNGFFDYNEVVFNLQLVDKREYPNFLNYLKRSPSPLKRMQLDAAKAILNSVQTTSYLRDLWNTNSEDEN